MIRKAKVAKDDELIENKLKYRTSCKITPAGRKMVP